MLAAGVLPLLGRRVDDHPRRPGAARMGAPVLDRRRPPHGPDQAEVVFLFDQWRSSSPLAALDRLLKESHGIAGARSVHIDATKATWPTRLWALDQQYGGARILFVFDHFEQLLESAQENADAQQFVDEWLRALKAPGLDANFLVVLDDRAWPRLKKLGARIPGFDEARVFELQARSERPALDPIRAAGDERQAEKSAVPEEVDFAASLQAMLSEFATSVRQTDPVPDDFQASVDALVFEVSRSARLEPLSPDEASSRAAEEDSRIAESIEASRKADAVRAADAQRVAQAQRAAEAEAARQAEAQRRAEAEAIRIAEAAAAAEARRVAEAAAAAEARRIAEELRRVEAERAAEAQRVAQAQRAAEAEAARQAEEAQRAADAEAKRIAEAWAAAEAKQIAEAAAAVEARRIADELRRAEAERAAEAQRVAQAQRAAEAEAARQAEEARRAADAEAIRIAEAAAAAAEAKRVAEAAAAAEARRMAEELRRVEAEQAAEAQRVAQAQRAAEAEDARQAEAQRAAEAEAKRRAEAAASDEARRVADAATAAAKAKVIAEAVELAAKAGRDSEAQWSAGEPSTRIESSAIAAASPGSPLRSAIKWGVATLAVMVVAVLLWLSLRPRPAAPETASPEASTTAPLAAAPATAPDAASAPIQTGAPSTTAATASAPLVTVPGAQPETTKPALFTVRMNAGGSDARIASELARAIGGSTISARGVAAGVDAVESLRAPRTLAIAQYDALRAARRSASAPPLRVLAPMYAEEVVFIVRADSRLKFIHDLRGRRLNIGSARDGSSQTVREIYRQMFGTAMAEPSQLDNDKALAELVAFRSIDAMVLVDAQPSAWLASLSPQTARGLRLLRLDRKHPEDLRALKAFQTAVLRAGSGIKKGEGIQTLATMSYLVVSGKDDADSKQLTDMVRALCRELPRLRADGHPKWRELRPSVNQDTGWPVVASAQSALKNCASDGPAPKPTPRRAPNSRSKR